MKNRKRLKRILLNILYYYGLGVYVTWAFELNLLNWQWWIQLLIFLIVMNAHRDIDKFINK